MAGIPHTHGTVIAIAVVFTLIALLFVGLRIWARVIKNSRLLADDYLIMTSAVLLVICITVPTIILAAHSHLGDHVMLAPNGMPMPPTYAFTLVLRIFQTVHVVPIMTVKLGILFLYRRIFRGPAFEATTLATVLLVAVWGISFFFSILFECTPINLSLKLPPGSPGIHCINQTANFWGLSISDVLMDLIILAIPFPFVWSLQMSLKHKFGVSGMFLLGVSLRTIAASIARLVCFISAGKLLAKNDPDLTYYVAPTAYWVVIECSLAIISACLPILRSIFHARSLETMLRSFVSKLSLRSNRSGISKQNNPCDNLDTDDSALRHNDRLDLSTSPSATSQSYHLQEDMHRSEQKPADGITVHRQLEVAEEVV